VSERQGPTGIEAMVCADIAERQRKGIAKYGTTVERNPLELRAWLTHLYQELTDAAIYARRAIREQEVRPRSAKMIGHKLMILREESGLTQAEFASLCGFSRRNAARAGDRSDAWLYENVAGNCASYGVFAGLVD
jgi:hypothetical protein